MINVFQVRLEHLEAVSTLFNQYRIFYGASSDHDAARQFLAERLNREDSILFAISSDGRIIGFTQLYPSFSSVSMKRIWILNDLFVDEDHRGMGVAKRLMGTAEDFARETGAIRIVLATQMSNVAARSLYELCGYSQDEDFHHYTLLL